MSDDLRIPRKNQKKAAQEDGVIIYLDEASFQQSGTKIQTWALIGLGTTRKSEPCRRSVKVYGAIRLDEKEPKFHFRFEREKYNWETFSVFVEQLMVHYALRGKKVHLILDNVAYHEKAAREWPKVWRPFIEFHFLPKFSPELNPVEEIWQKTKRMATHNRYFPKLELLREKLLRRFNRFQGNPSSLAGIVARYT